MKNSMLKNKKHAAVYDRWLFTLGGGEQVAFAYAEALRELDYQVEILTHKKIDTQKAESKMNVNLKGINIRYLPEMSTSAVSQFTQEYDVFINTSYLDYFPNLSKCGILSVFFPDQIFLTPFDYFKRSQLLPILKKFFIYPMSFEGFLFDEYKGDQLFRWLGKQSQISFSTPVYSVSVELLFETISISLIHQIEFYENDQLLTPISKQYKHKENKVIWKFVREQPFTSLSIHVPENEYADKITLSRFTIHHWRFRLYNFFKAKFPRWEVRLHGGPGVTRRADLQSYQNIVTISQFCKHWIDQYWRLPSTVLYPPVNITAFKPQRNKKNWIMHVGRFFVTGHSKKQLDLIKCFKELLQNNPEERGWELHLVGSVEPGSIHQQYFEQCQAEAEGAPVFFHQDIPFSELQNLLGQASIYWHATGLDEDENKRPILFEHFGITTVEAMASGCVPVVINKGGQPEIVVKDSGFVWNSREELLQYTKRLMSSPTLLKKMQQNAVERSKYFSREKFQERFNKLLKSSE